MISNRLGKGAYQIMEHSETIKKKDKVETLSSFISFFGNYKKTLRAGILQL